MSRSVEPDEREPADRTGRHDPRPRLQEAIERAAQDQPTMSELIDRLEKAGVRAVPQTVRNVHATPQRTGERPAGAGRYPFFADNHCRAHRTGCGQGHPGSWRSAHRRR